MSTTRFRRGNPPLGYVGNWETKIELDQTWRGFNGPIMRILQILLLKQSDFLSLNSGWQTRLNYFHLHYITLDFMQICLINYGSMHLKNGNYKNKWKGPEWNQSLAYTDARSSLQKWFVRPVRTNTIRYLSSSTRLPTKNSMWSSFKVNNMHLV